MRINAVGPGSWGSGPSVPTTGLGRLVTAQKSAGAGVTLAAVKNPVAQRANVGIKPRISARPLFPSSEKRGKGRHWARSRPRERWETPSAPCDAQDTQHRGYGAIAAP